jgi:6-phosphogluconolactonase
MMHVFSTVAELSQAAAQFFIQTAQTAVQQQGRFTVALTGGSSPKGLYELLAQSPYREQVPWSQTFVFWGDERAVPFEDSRNNAKMAFDLLLNYVPVPKEQIYPMQGDIPANESAQQYEDILQKHFGDQAPQFDLILLGMGDDGHTASLFPYTPVLQEVSHWVKELYLPEQEMFRVTLTAPFINQAKKIAFLVFGANKAATLYEVLNGEEQHKKYPSQLIKPDNGELHWFVDEAAAVQLKRER